MALILDCESCEAAVSSLAEIFNCDTDRLSDVLISIDISSVYQNLNDSPNVPSEEYLYEYVVASLGEPRETDMICWFHTTRTTAGNDFSEGILPLTEVLDAIWNMLISIFDESDICARLKVLRNDGMCNLSYNNKAENDFHAGPYAILVKDVAFHAERLWHHDYLEMPEIIEDICNGYHDAYGESIHEQVADALCPCIVKFLESATADQGHLEAALSYAYTYANELPISFGAVYCFDANNCTVENDDIVSIEFL